MFRLGRFAGQPTVRAPDGAVIAAGPWGLPTTGQQCEVAEPAWAPEPHAPRPESQ